MGYTDRYKELSAAYSTDISNISIPGSGNKIVNMEFVSDGIYGNFFSGNDHSINENLKFSYPVMIPTGKSNKVILILHGLNERSWDKYLLWAETLAEQTGSFVILFPISFHINRSPVSWKDPRSMLRFLKERIATRGETRSSSFANIALSNRLSDDPRRFLKSGYQTVYDLIKLMNQINAGQHPVIPAGSRVNIFAYSIGAFLAEIIMMANPDGLFSESKLFMFCGGSVFSNMKGESKLIMDRLAYEKIYNYYLEKFEDEIKARGTGIDHLVSGTIGMAFRSMIDFSRFRDIRNNALHRLGDQIYTLGLKKDRVIPVEGIVKTLTGNTLVETIDLNYSYTHENPFPVLNNAYSAEVDRSFMKIFETAGRFLS